MRAIPTPRSTEPRPPTRAQLETAATRLLKNGGPTKADLLVVDAGAGPLVVKDFSRKAWWMRGLGRLQVGRECRAYHWLGPAPGLAHLVGRIDAHALALEWIEGHELDHAPDRHERGAAYLAKLGEIVERLHARGLAHLDLRGRDNVMVDAEGRVRVLDLASAVWFRPGSLAHRLLFPWFRKVDAAALLKWKWLLGLGPYTDEEQAFLRRFSLWRSLWIFNRKGRS